MINRQTLSHDYEVLERLGAGGFGAVTKVQNRYTGHELAAKQAFSRKEMNADVKRRARVLAELQGWLALPEHPNLVTYRFFREIDGNIIIFSDFVAGGSFQDALQPAAKSASPWASHVNRLEFLLDVAIQCAIGLDVAHAAGLIHQDVKPSNILLDASEDQNVTAKLGDFGLSRVVRSAEQGATATAGFTPAYRSPEQARAGDLTAATDQWSLGVALLEAFAGQMTWSAGEVAPAVLEALANEAEPRPNRPKMPDGLVKVLQRMFMVDPAKRFSAMKHVAMALRDVYVQETAQNYKHPIESSDVYRVLPEIADWPWPDPIDARAHFARVVGLDQVPNAMAVLAEIVREETHAPVASVMSKRVETRTAGGELSTMTGSPRTTMSKLVDTRTADVPPEPLAPGLADESGQTPASLGSSILAKRWVICPVQCAELRTMREALADLDKFDTLIALVRARLNDSSPGLDIELAKLLSARAQILDFLKDAPGAAACFEEAMALIAEHPMLDNPTWAPDIEWTRARIQTGLARVVVRERVPDVARAKKHADIAAAGYAERKEPEYAYEYILAFRASAWATVVGDNSDLQIAIQRLNLAYERWQRCKWQQNAVLRIQTAEFHLERARVFVRDASFRRADDEFLRAMDSLEPVLATEKQTTSDASITTEFVAAAVLHAKLVLECLDMPSRPALTVPWVDALDQSIHRLEQLLSARHRGIKETLARLLLQRSQSEFVGSEEVPGAIQAAERAVVLYREAIDDEGRPELVPRLARAYVELAKLHERANDREHALDAYQDAVRVYEMLAAEDKKSPQYAAPAFLHGLERLLLLRRSSRLTKWAHERNRVITLLQQLALRTDVNLSGVRRELDLLSEVP